VVWRSLGHVYMEERARHALVDAHDALGRRRMLFFDMIPDDDLVHQFFFSMAYLLVAALGAR
jgi:hypothetical protein